MATLSVNYSQELVNVLAGDGEELGISEVLDTILEVEYQIGQYYAYFDEYYYDGDILELYYSDGSVATFYDVGLSNPNANSGQATASAYSLIIPDGFAIGIEGQLEYDYVVGGDFLSFEYTHLLINNYIIITQLPSYLADPTLGNVGLGLQGALSLSENGNLSGSLTALSAAAENIIEYTTWEGDFTVSGNLFSIVNGIGESNVTGYLQRVEEVYYDGSYLEFIADQPGWYLGDNQDPFTLLEDPDNFSGNDLFSIELPPILYEYIVLRSGQGNDEIFLSGGFGKVGLSTGLGNDQINKGSLGHAIDGGAGNDSISYEGNYSDYVIYFNSEKSSTIIQKGGRSDSVVNVEHFIFSDQSLSVSELIPNTPAEGQLLIYGDAIIGRSLLAESRAISDLDGPGEFGYQWYRNGEVIQGQTNNTYLLTESDDGQLITASVSYQDGADNQEMVLGEARLATLSTSDSYTDLIEMYVIILGRAPAQGGLDFWSGFINQGKGFDYIANEMWNSEGAREFYPSDMTTEEVVTSVYTNILVREPKEAGLSYWMGQWEENGAVDTMLEMIRALTLNNSSDPLAIADKELFQSKVDVGGYLANTVQNTDVDLASAAFDYLEAGNSLEDTKTFIDTEMGIIGQADAATGDDMFA